MADDRAGGADDRAMPWERLLPPVHDPRATLALPAAGPVATPDGLAVAALERGYIIGARIGRGGLGQVNLAVQQPFGREVAIKRLHGGASDQAARRKFFAEALIAAQLEHPNIVPIHDLLLDGEGQLQLVMKRVEGVPWRTLLEQPSGPPARARLALDDHLDILLKVCDAVACAHGRGILHCDLKPDNVMVGAFGEVLLMDWGCALAFTAGHHPALPQVRDLVLPCGTPSYLAPEMAMAQAARIGPVSDVYQLGAVLYELLTGTRPNRGTEVMAVMKDAAWGTVVPPHQAAPARTIPDELSAIAMAALAKDPAQRIPTVAAFAARLLDYRRHAQAVTLAARARALVDQAGQHVRSGAEGPGQDDLVRKALSSAEQACEIWPEWSGAQVALYDAQLASARRCIDSGAAATALGLARQAEGVAAQLARPALVALAQELHEEAAAADAEQRAHQRQLRLARVGVIAGTALLVAGLAIAVVVVEGARYRAASALAVAEEERAKAEQALLALGREQHQRSAEEKTSAPALVAQARRQIQARQWAEAAQALETAAGYDPRLLEARELRAAVLVGAGRYREAMAAAGEWLALAPGQAQAVRLRELCALANDGTRPPVEVQDALAELFDELKIYTLAEVFALSPGKHLELYRKRLDQAWPGAGGTLAIRPDGRLVSGPGSGRVRGLAGRAEVVDLAPLSGMPFAVLDLARTHVHDLGPLSGMPLEELDCSFTPLEDLHALSGLPLRTLILDGTRIKDLAELKGLAALERLSMAGCPVRDLTPLQGRSFALLNLSGSEVESLAELAGRAQGELILRHTRVHALSPLIGSAIGSLDLTGCPLDDLAILSRLAVRRFAGLSIPLSVLGRIRALPLTGLELTDTGPSGDLRELRGVNLTALSLPGGKVTDLGPLAGMALGELRLAGNPVQSLSALSGMPLRRLDISHCQVRDLAPLRDCPLEELRASGSPLRDLSPLAGRPLRLLFIDECPVQDLGALRGLPLEEMRLGPFSARSYTGLDALRALPTLRILGTSPEQAMPAGEFWRLLAEKRLP
jgi:Leucine-rich repeat (LRR) protein